MTIGRMQNPVRGIMHGTAAIVALFGGTALVLRGETVGSRVALAIFAVALVCLYTTSALYHSIPWRYVWKKRMQRLDLSMIFFLIAGTYTPISWIALEGATRTVTLGVVWTVAVVGILQQVFFPVEENTFGLALMTTIGWFAVFILVPFTRRAGGAALAMVAVGGVLHTVGMVFLILNRPKLLPRVFSYHELFHVMVVAATTLHFTATWRYVTPLA